MSKIVYLCFKDSETIRPGYEKAIELLSKRLSPDNITLRPPQKINDHGIMAGIFNPAPSILTKNTSVCMGILIGPSNNWWKPMANIPNGNYALFRGDENFVEILSDAAGSRTVWYFWNKELLIASTSQRAIVYFLQSFDLNEAAIPWVLSSGSLGPGLSWDKRIKCLGGNSRLVLNRNSWKLTVKSDSPYFCSHNVSEAESKIQLIRAITDTFNDVNLDFTHWILTLSGGIDSRVILLMLKKKGLLKCVTWGFKASLLDRESDIGIAGSLADYYNLEHQIYEISLSEEPISKIINRFLAAGEGRIEHLSGYSDGFKLWKKLFEKGTTGIIRGDQGFGFDSTWPDTPLGVRQKMGAFMLTDLISPENVEKFRFKEQIWPESFHQRDFESLAAWSDRLYHSYRLPYLLAALNDLKLPYVEVFNPLLSNTILEQIRKTPDNLRANKQIFHEIIHANGPKIEFAKTNAINNNQNLRIFLSNPKIAAFFLNELNTERARKLFSGDFLHFLNNGLEIRRINMAGPKTKGKPRVNFYGLAFRSYIVLQMSQILNHDAVSFKKGMRT